MQFLRYKIPVFAFLAICFANPSFAQWPTTDLPAISGGVTNNLELVKQYKMIKESTAMIGKMNTTIGDSKSSVSKLVADNEETAALAKAKEAKENQRVAERRKEYKEEQQLKEDQKKQRLEAAVSRDEARESFARQKEAEAGRASSPSASRTRVSAASQPMEAQKISAVSGDSDLSAASSAPVSSDSKIYQPVSEIYKTDFVSEEEMVMSKPVTAQSDVSSRLSTNQTQGFSTKEVMSSKEDKMQTSSTSSTAVSDQKSAVSSSAAKVSSGTPSISASSAASPDISTAKSGTSATKADTLKFSPAAQPAVKNQPQPFLKRPAVNSNGTKQQPVTYQKNSFKLSTTLAFAQGTDEGFVPDGTKNGNFVFSTELARYCEISVDEAYDPNIIKDCLTKLVCCMNDPRIGPSTDCKSIYNKIMFDTLTSETANNMYNKTLAASYESEVSAQTSSMSTSSNERDDIASLTLSNVEQNKLLNRSIESSLSKVIVDALASLNGIDRSTLEGICPEPEED